MAQMTTPLGEATGELKELLIELAERYVETSWRPCLDAETTLEDWYDTGHLEEIEAMRQEVARRV